jgi:hypothetical protein
MPIESARKCAREAFADRTVSKQKAALKAEAIGAESGGKSDVRNGVMRDGTVAALGLN